MQSQPTGLDHWFVRVVVSVLLATGLLVTGLLLTRGGRALLRDAWRGRRRTRVEDRVLELLWREGVWLDSAIDVTEEAPGEVLLSGRTRTPEQRRIAVSLAARAAGVVAVRDELEDPVPRGIAALAG